MPCGRENPNAAFAAAWQLIVNDYRRAEFTYESDRLIALAGVAKAIEDSKGFTYVVGIWKELWPVDLLWRRSDNPIEWLDRRFNDGPYSLEPRQKRGYLSKSSPPSWSWAAGNFEKTFWLLDHEGQMAETIQITYLARVIEFTSPTPRARYTGPGADEERITLTLEGKVLRGLVRASKKDGGIWVRMSDGLSYNTHLKHFIDWDYEPEDGDPVLFLWLLSCSVYSFDPYTVGLVLTPEESPQKSGVRRPRYRRVGCFMEDYFTYSKSKWEEESICLC